jgi:DNA-binding response OmpR family regulator
MPKILVIEDEPDIRNILETLLEQEGYEVTTADDGESGFKKAKRLQPDLIISDVLMPRMSGFELAKAIRQEETLELTRFVFLTAKAEPESIREGMRYGDDYLTKPFTRLDLLDVIENQLQRAKAVEEFRAKTTKEIKLEIAKNFGDRVGNLLSGAFNCFYELYEATTPDEKTLAYTDGKRVLVELLAMWTIYQKKPRN